jgi:hypothetical protein
LIKDLELKQFKNGVTLQREFFWFSTTLSSPYKSVFISVVEIPFFEKRGKVLMGKITQSVMEVIKNNSNVEEVYEEFKITPNQRLRDLIYKNVKNLNTSYKTLKTVLIIFQNIIPILGAFLGYYSTQLTLPLIIFSWAIYIIFSFLLIWIINNLPDDLEKLGLEVDKIKLINLSEKLASKIALFDQLTDLIYIDDWEFINNKITPLVSKNLDEVNEKDREILNKCINPKYIFNSSRDTNITIKSDNLKIDDKKRAKLQGYTKELCELANTIFGTATFSSKLYLRTVKNFAEKEVEILVPFSRFPIKEASEYGTSWIKSRGNLSIVWDSLEKGNYLIKDVSSEGLYYKSVLAVCLPGRIGVLTIQSDQSDTFLNQVDKSTFKLLAQASAQLVRELFLDEGSEK